MATTPSLGTSGSGGGPGSGSKATATSTESVKTETFAQATQDVAAALHRAADTTQDAFTYPLPREATTDGTGASNGRSVDLTGGNINRIAQDTIRQALGWRYRSDDVRGFAAAINRAFTLTENEDGIVESAWTPQTYAIQADLGEITGAQASVFEQAKITINYILPLLDGLQALRADSDDDDIKAITGIVRMKLNSILTELGRVGGPRVQRVDLVFEELLGLPTFTLKPEQQKAAAEGPSSNLKWEPVAISDGDAWLTGLKTLEVERAKGDSAYSLLRQLGEELGLDPQLANTVEEERDYTNYLIVIDSVIALRSSWMGKRNYFYRGGGHHTKSYLGTQLVWLSRQIEVVAESVRDAYAAMDSVYFGAQERQATDIYFVDTKDVTSEKATANTPLPEAAITVGDLLEWVETFATQEGPQLLQEGGKDGVIAFRSTVKRLEEWIEAARKFSESGKGHAPRSFFTARVARALKEIETQLDATAQRTKGISRSVRNSEKEFIRIADLPLSLEARVKGLGHQNGEHTT